MNRCIGRCLFFLWMVTTFNLNRRIRSGLTRASQWVSAALLPHRWDPRRQTRLPGLVITGLQWLCSYLGGLRVLYQVSGRGFASLCRILSGAGTICITAQCLPPLRYTNSNIAITCAGSVGAYGGITHWLDIWCRWGSWHMLTTQPSCLQRVYWPVGESEGRFCLALTSKGGKVLTACVPLHNVR